MGVGVWVIDSAGARIMVNKFKSVTETIRD